MRFSALLLALLALAGRLSAADAPWEAETEAGPRGAAAAVAVRLAAPLAALQQSLAALEASRSASGELEDDSEGAQAAMLQRAIAILQEDLGEEEGADGSYGSGAAAGNGTVTASCTPIVVEEEEPEGPKWYSVVFVVILVVFSALFSGLTLGLMSLDMTELELITESGSEEDRIYAAKIMPVREKGNLLLCTLLLGNTGVNAMLSILMADLTSGTMGFILSTATIVIFGEITPQALCSRYALRIGAATINIVRVLIVLLWILAYPISKVLDYVLGREIATIYNRGMLKGLLDLHAAHPETSGVKTSDAKVLKGALDFSAKRVEQVMTPLEDVFMLEIDEKLDYDTLASVMQHGYSRVPVYEGVLGNITDILLVKDLALLNPEEEIPIRAIIDVYGRDPMKVFSDWHLDEVLNRFKQGKSHLAVVHRIDDSGPGDPVYINVGIVTLEDLVEELIMDEIVDETDVFVDVHAQTRVETRGRIDYLSMTKKRKKRNNEQQCQAISSYLSGSYDEFRPNVVDSAVLLKLITINNVVTIQMPPTGEVHLYERGKPNVFFTLILRGRVRVTSGGEGFTSELGPWSVMGRGSLMEDHWKPDFTATIIEPVSLWRITRYDYVSVLRASQFHTAGASPSAGPSVPQLKAGNAVASADNDDDDDDDDDDKDDDYDEDASDDEDEDDSDEDESDDDDDSDSEDSDDSDEETTDEKKKKPLKGKNNSPASPMSPSLNPPSKPPTKPL